MKNLMYLFIAAIMFAFTACGGSEECATEETIVTEEVIVEEVVVDTTAVVVDETTEVSA